jgi:mono/diheme cytochrome c family protein
MRGVAAIVLLAAGAAACGGEAPKPETEATTTVETTVEAIPAPAAGYNAREGRAIFQHYCAPCHGAEGQGDGFNAYSLDPKPRDLTDPAFKAEKSDEDLAETVRIGGGAAGLSTGMPPWGRTLNARQIGNVVAYVRALTPPPE